MKKTRKILAMAACAVLLVCISVGATVAYLTSTDEVKNTFTVGKVAITLDEAKVDADGQELTGEKAKRVKTNSYHLYPGHDYDKDPTVTVKQGSDASYIKLVVTVNHKKELDAIFKTLAAQDPAIALKDVVVGYDSTNWVLKSNTYNDTDNTRTYEFWYKETVAAPTADVKLDALFDQIKVPECITSEQLATISSNLSINITAYAIQADGFADAAAAWDAYK